MNRTTLAGTVSGRTDLSPKAVDAVLAAAFEEIAAAVAGGERVAVAGFGTFERRDRSARTGRNPQTGQSIEIPAGVVPAFKAAAGFRQLVAGARAR